MAWEPGLEPLEPFVAEALWGWFALVFLTAGAVLTLAVASLPRLGDGSSVCSWPVAVRLWAAILSSLALGFGAVMLLLRTGVHI